MKKRLIVMVVVGALALTGIASAVAAQLQADKPPFEVTTDGKPIMDSLPEKVPVLDSNGDLSGYIDREDLFPGKPSMDPNTAPPLGHEEGRTSRLRYGTDIEVTEDE